MAQIVVVNDDAPFIELMTQLLEDAGYSVAGHQVGHTAYEAVKQLAPRLVVLDILLEHPDSGWLVLDKLRLDPATAQIPVIICTADQRYRDTNEAYLRTKRCRLLLKPFELQDMLQAIADELHSIAPSSETIIDSLR
jgi:CheY-like chemotaxis protein